MNPAKIIIFFLLALTGMSLQAQQPSAHDGGDPYAGYAEEVFLDMDFDPNIATPVIPERSRNAVRKYVRSVAESLTDNFIVDLMRDGEVMVLTIPTDDIFLPNDTLLSQDSPKILNRLIPLLEDALMYKVVLSMNVDNTGSEPYREQLSLSRLNSVYEWIISLIDRGKASEDLIVVPFSMGSDDPANDNLTRKHRKENRRLEIYLVPGPKMISQADSGQL